MDETSSSASGLCLCGQGRRHSRQRYATSIIPYENLAIATNVIHAAATSDDVEKLLFLGSSCIYPKFAPQPIEESSLLTGPLEPTNEWYAVAKIRGLKLCQAYRRQHRRDFISAMPTNLYGPGDNFDLDSSHVIPALIRKACAMQSFSIGLRWSFGGRDRRGVNSCMSMIAPTR